MLAISTDAMTIDAMADLQELGRRGRSQELASHAQQLRSSAGWNVAAALQLAAAWLLAGDPRQADLALLEADQLDPSLALVADVWGLWPASSNAGADGPIAAQRQQALALAEQYQRWRNPDAQALWRQVLPQLKADWRSSLKPPVGDDLLILGRASATPGAPTLDPLLEPELVLLVSDAEIAAEPAASNRYWQLLATIRPDWDLARIRAADLALARGELETSDRWLSDPPVSALANPWFHDVKARRALTCGEVGSALAAWSEAIRTAQAMEGGADLLVVFEQRRRQARRGPGVLQVRSLANRGEQDQALLLLEQLLTEDPQWQPLRSLREQLLSSAAAATPAAAVAPAAAAVVPAGETHAGSPPPTAIVDFNGLLDRAAACLRALGLQSLAPSPNLPADLPALAAELSELDRRLSDYEARFALA